MLLVTYQKENGCIIQRQRKTMLPYKIGERTSMGWIVLNIEYQYKDKYYPEYKYHMLIQKDKQLNIKKRQMIELCTFQMRTLVYYFIAIVVVNLLKFILGIR